ncbi:MAG TPA: DUF3224 domain-containing protein [Gammaproteobacteria bacterium]|nr:DUF3224 domain-containing protein [Gammaproteobacteria bacterium]
MNHHATGTFDVKPAPQAAEGEAEAGPISRTKLVKQFHGDLEASGTVQMLGVMTATRGSAGYVAMETVTGTLDGRKGGFTLQHSGTMTRGALRLSVTVVPDSGTGELAEIAGEMTIDIVDGEHRYEFEYKL